WIATDRSRARRCVEACVYGTLDFVGYPRFPAPVEFIAAVIAYYVHPVNIQTACLIMEGAEFTENIINGVERPVKAAELFAFTLRVRAGNSSANAESAVWLFSYWRYCKGYFYVVTDAASGVVDIFHGIDKAVADTWNNFWKDGKADGIGSNLSRK